MTVEAIEGRGSWSYGGPRGPGPGRSADAVLGAENRTEADSRKKARVTLYDPRLTFPPV
jgi:hypothetical protein